MSQLYWVKLTADGEEFGPFTAADLRLQAAKRQILPESLVSLDHSVWHAARRFKGLFEASTAAQRVMAGMPPVPSVESRTASAPPPVIRTSAPGAFVRRPLDPDELSRNEQAAIFRMLTVVAWIVGVALFIWGLDSCAAIVYGTSLFNFDRPKEGRAEFAFLINAIIITVLGLLFLVSGIFGRSKSPLGKILILVLGIVLVVLDLGGFVVSLLGINRSAITRLDAIGWSLLAKSPDFLFGATFPILCIVAAVAWFGDRSK